MMPKGNRPPKSRRYGQRSKQPRTTAEKVVTYIAAVAFWACLYYVLPETWREWVDRLTGESVPDWLEWTAYLAIFALVVFVDLLIEYVQKISKNRNGSGNSGQGTQTSHINEQ